MKILILGGCHANAFGLNDLEDGYVETLRHLLKRYVDEITFTIYAPLTINDASLLIEENIVILEDYDIILVQLGNYEFSLNLRKNLKNFISKKSKSKKDNKIVLSKNNHLPASYQGCSKNNQLVSSFGKKHKFYFFSHIASLTLKTVNLVYSFRFITNSINRFDNFLTLIDKEDISKKAIIIAPTPVTIPHVNYTRSLGDRLMSEKSFKRNIYYLSPFIDHTASNHFVQDDRVHLNEIGHFLLAKSLSKEIISRLNKILEL